VRRHAGFVLRALNEKHHHERDDVRHGIDHELPAVGVVEQLRQRQQFCAVLP
jgi:hypothetical protein